MNVHVYEVLSVVSVVFLSTSCGGYILGISRSNVGLFIVSISSIIIPKCISKHHRKFLTSLKMILDVAVFIKK